MEVSKHSSRGWPTHSAGSIKSSMSRRKGSGSTLGRCLRRRMSSAGPMLGFGRGRSSATGAPSRVTTIRSPRSTRRNLGRDHGNGAHHEHQPHSQEVCHRGP